MWQPILSIFQMKERTCSIHYCTFTCVDFSLYGASTDELIRNFFGEGMDCYWLNKDVHFDSGNYCFPSPNSDLSNNITAHQSLVARHKGRSFSNLPLTLFTIFLYYNSHCPPIYKERRQTQDLSHNCVQRPQLWMLKNTRHAFLDQITGSAFFGRVQHSWKNSCN